MFNCSSHIFINWLWIPLIQDFSIIINCSFLEETSPLGSGALSRYHCTSAHRLKLRNDSAALRWQVQSAWASPWGYWYPKSQWSNGKRVTEAFLQVCIQTPNHVDGGVVFCSPDSRFTDLDSCGNILCWGVVLSAALLPALLGVSWRKREMVFTPLWGHVSCWVWIGKYYCSGILMLVKSTHFWLPCRVGNNYCQHRYIRAAITHAVARGCSRFAPISLSNRCWSALCRQFSAALHEGCNQLLSCCILRTLLFVMVPTVFIHQHLTQVRINAFSFLIAVLWV